MRHLRLIWHFIRTSALVDAAHRANFAISLLHSALNLVVGVAGLWVLFGQVDAINGWDRRSTLALLGVYLTLSALRGLFLGPSLEALAGMDGEVWSGRFDFTLLRPVDTQFIASFGQWRLFGLVDLLLGAGVIGAALAMPGAPITAGALVAFLLTLAAGLIVLYSLLLICAALVFRSPGFLFSWVFDGIFQMARYPVGIYPGWLRLVLTWVIPVGLMTTVPAQALRGGLSIAMVAGALAFAMALLVATSLLFRSALRSYVSASS